MRRLALALLVTLAAGCSCNDGDPPPPPNPCMRRTCQANECGELLDGCNGILRCPVCLTGQTCGGGGTANVCGTGSCSPKTCFELGKNCDRVSDGCGKLLDCGRCMRPSDCGLGKPPNVCGGQSCQRNSCAGACDGLVDDGCGGKTDCTDAGCVGFDTCGGGGTPFFCGCTRRTCADLKKNCGGTEDGCGATLQCGTCSPDAGSCGGTGFANVCGSCDTGGRVCNGSCWCWDHPRPGGNPVSVITGTATGDVWLLSAGGSFAHGGLDGFTFTGSPNPSLNASPRNAWARAEDDLWAVSNQGGSQLIHFDGVTWQTEPLPTGAALTGVWGHGADELWVVGSSGTLFHRKDGTWLDEGDGGVLGFEDVWASGPSDVWAGGAVLRHYDGGSWSPAQSVNRVLDLHGTAPDDVWSVDVSRVNHFDGLAWSPSYTAYPMRRVWAIARDDVWVGGTGGRVAHWDGTGWSAEQLGVSEETTALWARGHDDVWLATSIAQTGFSVFHRDTAGWHAVTPVRGGDLTGVTVTTSGEAWAVGENGRVLRFDGARWSPVLSRTALPLSSVTSAGGRVWAAGSVGTIIGGADGGFEVEASGTATQLARIFAVSPAEVYAVTSTGVLFRSAGDGQWSRLGSATGASSVRALWASSDHDLWLGDGLGRTYHLDDAGWSMLLTGQAHPVNGLWGEAAELFAAAGSTTSGALLRFTDGGWTALTALGAGTPYFSAWGRSASDVWFSGAGGALRHWDGTTLETAAKVTGSELRSVAGGSSGPLWAVGSEGVVLRVDGLATVARVSVTEPRIDETLTGVFGFARDDVWAVSQGGTAHHFDGTAWREHHVPLSHTGAGSLDAVWGARSDDVWAVGFGGRVVHWDGGSWSTVAAPALVRNFGPLTGLWGTAADDIWTVGGDILGHWNGAAWSRIVLSNVTSVEAVHGTARDDVWAVGNQLWRWDGSGWVQHPNPAFGVRLSSVWCLSRTDCWATGIGSGKGVLLRWGGSSWRLVESPANDPLVLWGRGPDDLFVFCVDGSAYHWDGVDFSRQHTGADRSPSAAWGSDAGVWLVGPRMALFHPP